MYIEVEGQTKPWTEKPTMRKKEILCNNNKKKKRNRNQARSSKQRSLKMLQSVFSINSDKLEIFLNFREKNVARL